MTASPPTGAFLSVRDLKVHFSTADGIVKAIDGLSFDARARQDARHRRRVRLRQVGVQLGDPRAAPRHERHRQRRDPARRRRPAQASSNEDMRKRRGRDMAMIFQDPLSAMHPYYSVGNQIMEAYQVHHTRDQEGGAHARDRDARPRRHPATRPSCRRLPAPVLRRYAPARDDRDGADQQPEPAHRRRADHRARRDRPGADPRPAPGPAARLRRRRSSSSPTTSASWRRWPMTCS